MPMDRVAPPKAQLPGQLFYRRENLSEVRIASREAGFARGDPDFAQILATVEELAGELGLRRSYAVHRHVTELDAQRWEHKRVTLLMGPAAEFLESLSKADLTPMPAASSRSSRDPLI